MLDMPTALQMTMSCIRKVSGLFHFHINPQDMSVRLGIDDVRVDLLKKRIAEDAMRGFMRTVSSIVLVAILLASALPTQAKPAAPNQDLTGDAIVTAARAIITQLQNLAASVGGDVMIATNNAATQLSAATDHLASVLHDQVNVPITQLNGTIQNEALLLNSMVTQMNLLVQHQRACLFSQADIFVAGVNTALATFKSGILFVSSGNPTITQFIFDGHQTPNIVPREGGPLVVKGFHLWVKIPPLVSITKGPENNSQLISKLDPSRATDDNSYRITISKDLVSQNAGSCIYLQTTPRKKSGLLGLGQTNLNTLIVPMCIPQTTTMKVRLTAQIVYDVPSQDTHPLDPFKNFRFDNADCGHTHSVSHSEGWPLPSGFAIISVESRKSEQRNDNNNIQFSFNGNTITAAGTQDSPTCGIVHIPPFGPDIEKLFHTAIWSYDARPVISGTAFSQRTESASTELMDVVIPATQLCVSLAKIANTAGRKTSITYTVTPIINGKDGKGFSSPVYTTDDATNVFALPNVTAFGGEFSITGNYNPNPVNGKCQACITLNNIGQCGF